MKKKWMMAVLLSLALTLAGCSGGGSASEGEASGLSSEKLETKEADASKESSAENTSGTESAAPDGKETAGNKQDAGDDDSWKGIYAEFLEKEIVPWLDSNEEDWKNGWSFGMIYMNDDLTPELVISSGYEAAGNVLCTVIDGKVKQFQTSRLNIFYKEFGNILDNSDGNMGYYYDNLVKIGADGFELIHEGTNEDVYGDNGPTGERRYAMDGQTVTKEEYYKTVDGLLPATERTYWVKGSSFDNMMDYLKGNGPANYKEAYREVIEEIAKAAPTSDFAPANAKFALIERDNQDPLLLCVGNRTFNFYAFEDGLLQDCPDWWFSETELVLVYPNLGIVQNHQYFENNESYISDYWMKLGSVYANYLRTECEMDADWEPVLDANGVPITIYLINGSEVSREAYYKFADRNAEKAKQQLAASDAEYTFIDYLGAEEMLKLLK